MGKWLGFCYPSVTRITSRGIFGGDRVEGDLAEELPGSVSEAFPPKYMLGLPVEGVCADLIASDPLLSIL
jgi:hypothetical protein